MNSVISWLGGKRLLRKHIIPKIPKHNLYCEVFGGAGWVLFGKSEKPEDWITEPKKKYTEIYNDLNGELVNFWKYIKWHPEAFTAELNQYLISRELFDLNKKSPHPTELERAVIFYYLLVSSYGSQSKNFTIQQGHHYLPLRDLDKVKRASERLKEVIIENTDFAQLMEKVDAEDTFFYIDPPYYQKEYLYKRNELQAFDGHEKLAELLTRIKGKFILSYNEHEYIRALYENKGFVIEKVEAPYSISGKNQIQTELLISSFR